MGEAKEKIRKQLVQSILDLYNDGRDEEAVSKLHANAWMLEKNTYEYLVKKLTIRPIPEAENDPLLKAALEIMGGRIVRG